MPPGSYVYGPEKRMEFFFGGGGGSLYIGAAPYIPVMHTGELKAACLASQVESIDKFLRKNIMLLCSSYRRLLWRSYSFKRKE